MTRRLSPLSLITQRRTYVIRHLDGRRGSAVGGRRGHILLGAAALSAAKIRDEDDKHDAAHNERERRTGRGQRLVIRITRPFHLARITPVPAVFVRSVERGPALPARPLLSSTPAPATATAAAAATTGLRLGFGLARGLLVVVSGRLRLALGLDARTILAWTLLRLPSRRGLQSPRP
jgi:hypothetical protein